MRYLSYFLIFAMLISVGCRKSARKDNRPMANREEALGGITAFSLSGISRIEFIKSNADKFQMTGLDEQVAAFAVKRTGTLLTISKNDLNAGNNKVTLYVYTTNVSSIQLISDGVVLVGDVLNSSEAKMSASSVSELNVLMNVNTIQFDATSISSLVLSGHIQNGALNITSVSSLNTLHLKNDNAIVTTSSIASHTP
jgi:hypothetical protein